MFPLKDTQPSYTRPVVTIALIVVNLLIFFFEWSLDPRTLNAFIAYYGLVPDHLRLSSMVTSMILHGGWLHVLGNMWFLWIFGVNVEDLLGHARYLLFYLLCGVAAAVAHVFFNPYSTLPTVGASGAIAGVMGAYLVKFPRARILSLVFILFFITWIEIPAPIMLAYWFFIQLFSGLGSIAGTHLSEGGVAWFSHVGGFITGIVLVTIMGRRRYSY
jgi:membrane associated rhomboid family serine protease